MSKEEFGVERKEQIMFNMFGFKRRMRGEEGETRLLHVASKNTADHLFGDHPLRLGRFVFLSHLP